MLAMLLDIHHQTISDRWDHSGFSIPMGGVGTSSQKFAHSSHLEKKFPFPHGKIPDPPLSPVPPNTKFLFPQQVIQSFWTGKDILKNSTGTELSLWIGIRGLEQGPTVREIYKLDDIAYFGKFSKQVSWKKILFWALATPVFLFLSGFSFRDTDNLDSRGREGTFICNFACEMTITYF